jgi:exopolysaccharide biosynthesis polyprenyl glycosylphosphotransferase
MNTVTSAAAKVLPTDFSRSRARKRIFASFPLKKAALCISDLILINVALFLALVLRHMWLPQDYTATQHFTLLGHVIGFNLLHGVWLFVFYSVGLYDIEHFASRREVIRNIALAVLVCGTIGILLFYGVSFLKLTPKIFRMPPRIALALDLTFLAVLLYATRDVFIRRARNGFQVKVISWGDGRELGQFREFLDRNAHLGYTVVESVDIANRDGTELLGLQNSVEQRLLAGRADILTVTRRLNDNPQLRAFFYKLLCSGAHVIEFSHLYEEVTGKVPSSLINEGWFVDNVRAFNRRGFEIGKRLVDICAALALGIPTLLLFPIVAVAILLDSTGPVIFRQKRVGRDGRVFEMVKFRTMSGVEINRAHWAAEAESRITRVGRFLRTTRIDELPQLWNVLKGDMSLVGPRPEWTTLYAQLIQNIPFYDSRTLVRPGLTGWAQINFGYGASFEDDREKLQYDLYYIKNRSIGLDLSILLKTVSTILRYEGR